MHVLISQDPGWQGEERAMLRPPTRVAAEEARGEKEQLAGQWRSKRGGQRQYHVLGLPPSKGFVFCTEPGPRSTVSSQHVTLTSRVCLLALGLTLHILRVRQILLRCAASEMLIPPHTHTHISVSETGLRLTITGILSSRLARWQSRCGCNRLAVTVLARAVHIVVSALSEVSVSHFQSTIKNSR